MKYLLFLCLIFSSLNVKAFFYDEEDKNLHVGVSFVSTYTLTSVLLLTTDLKSREASLYAAGIVILAGIIKESNDNKFDKDDMGANLVGTSLATVPFIVVDF